MGLADPGAGAALSLNITRCTVLIHYPDMETLAAAQALGRIAVEVNEAFGASRAVLAERIAAEEQVGEPHHD